MTVQISPELGEAMKLINSKPPIFTLCGSAKYEKEFHDWNRWLTFAGITVISLACFPSIMGAHEWYTKSQKAMLDQVHRNKIDAAGAILVINKDGYIGQSTMGEILYAFSRGKQVFSAEMIGPVTAGKCRPLSSWMNDAPYDMYEVYPHNLKELING